jgi:hypothetical protein
MKVPPQGIGAAEKAKPDEGETGQFLGPGKWMNHYETGKNLQ